MSDETVRCPKCGLVLALNVGTVAITREEVKLLLEAARDEGRAEYFPLVDDDGPDPKVIEIRKRIGLQ